MSHPFPIEQIATYSAENVDPEASKMISETSAMIAGMSGRPGIESAEIEKLVRFAMLAAYASGVVAEARKNMELREPWKR